MDINDIRTIVTVLAFLSFVGIVLWAWSGKRQAAFEAAARLPLEEEETIRSGAAGASGHQQGE